MQGLIKVEVQYQSYETKLRNIVVHSYLDMPSLDELSQALLKRKAPIKAVLLDQNGPLCGIGNWLVHLECYSRLFRSENTG